MTDHDDTMRRDLAEAMGWTAVHLDHDGVIRGLHPDGTSRHRRAISDPLHSADDAEALEAWMLEQGYEVDTRNGPDRCSVHVWSIHVWIGARSHGYISVFADDEPDSTVRRRRAMVEAAWAAVQAGHREVAP